MTDKLLFTCRVCGGDVDTHPLVDNGNGELVGVQGVCPEHCEDHDYEYDSFNREHYCQHCGDPAPADWYYSDDDELGGGYVSLAPGEPVGWSASSMNGNAAELLKPGTLNERADRQMAWDRWVAFCQANGRD